ncbi:hypothetical protein DPMN_173576 [Dreissena polymorpha]|uniref:Uncharacterized protein n=1 Tax=Dreissena polymorpha TaxID=45954 RepID=A0A9D4E343_DREPO|nr:hypothetical protein DPMN_173576 [Dreissena polymorpha]
MYIGCKKETKGGYNLMYGLLDQVFIQHEFASSKGTGYGKLRLGDEYKPVLDQEQLDLFRG